MLKELWSWNSNNPGTSVIVHSSKYAYESYNLPLKFFYVTHFHFFNILHTLPLNVFIQWIRSSILTHLFSSHCYTPLHTLTLPNDIIGGKQKLKPMTSLLKRRKIILRELHSLKRSNCILLAPFKGENEVIPLW